MFWSRSVLVWMEWNEWMVVKRQLWREPFLNETECLQASRLFLWMMRKRKKKDDGMNDSKEAHTLFPFLTIFFSLLLQSSKDLSWKLVTVMWREIKSLSFQCQTFFCFKNNLIQDNERRIEEREEEEERCSCWKKGEREEWKEEVFPFLPIAEVKKIRPNYNDNATCDDDGSCM